MITSLAEANELLEEKQVQIQELTKKFNSSQLKVKMLQHQVEQLLWRVYGRRSEKLDPNQLMFDNLILDILADPVLRSQPLAEPPAEGESERKRPQSTKRRHPGRIPIPEHL